VNWWLAILAFVLGLVVTGGFMVRRVTREVPVFAPRAATPRKAAAPPEPVAPTAVAPEPVVAVEMPDDTASLAEPPPPVEPHGPGSARPGADGKGPAGWPVKGNEESKLYHSPESPSYGVTRAEVWFQDVATAEAAGFNRWDSGKSQRGLKPRT
jgi:uncharacterized membrane protein ArfC